MFMNDLQYIHGATETKSKAMKKTYSFWVYITTNPERSTLYIGMTNNLIRRLVEHYMQRGNSEHFTGRYYCYNLVWYEWHQYVFNAIAREKELKRLLRKEKEELIAKFNPEWKFLNAEICGCWPPSPELLKELGKDDKKG